MAMAAPGAEAGREAGLDGGSLTLAPPRRGESTCYICCERRADAVVMECGHGGVCFTCATHLADTPPHKCPRCRRDIQEVLKLHDVREFGRVVALPNGDGDVSGVLVHMGLSRGGAEELGLAAAGRGEPEVEERQGGLDPRPLHSPPGGGEAVAVAEAVPLGGHAPSSVPSNPTPSDSGVAVAAPAPAPTPTPASAPAPAPAAPTRSGVGGIFQRFSGPDVVGATTAIPAAPAAVQRDGDAATDTGMGQRGAGAATAPTAPLEPTGRNSIEARTMCEEAGWLDPV